MPKNPTTYRKKLKNRKSINKESRKKIKNENSVHNKTRNRKRRRRNTVRGGILGFGCTDANCITDAQIAPIEVDTVSILPNTIQIESCGDPLNPAITKYYDELVNRVKKYELFKKYKEGYENRMKVIVYLAQQLLNEIYPGKYAVINTRISIITSSLKYLFYNVYSGKSREFTGMLPQEELNALYIKRSKFAETFSIKYIHEILRIPLCLTIVCVNNEHGVITYQDFSQDNTETADYLRSNLLKRMFNCNNIVTRFRNNDDGIANSSWGTELNFNNKVEVPLDVDAISLEIQERPIDDHERPITLINDTDKKKIESSDYYKSNSNIRRYIDDLFIRFTKIRDYDRSRDVDTETQQKYIKEISWYFRRIRFVMFLAQYLLDKKYKDKYVVLKLNKIPRQKFLLYNVYTDRYRVYQLGELVNEYPIPTFLIVVLKNGSDIEESQVQDIIRSFSTLKNDMFNFGRPDFSDLSVGLGWDNKNLGTSYKQWKDIIKYGIANPIWCEEINFEKNLIDVLSRVNAFQGHAFINFTHAYPVISSTYLATLFVI